MRRGRSLFSGLITIRSGASRISIGNNPRFHMAKIGPPGWHGTTFLMSERRTDSLRPKSVNGGFAGHGVLDQGGGPAGSPNVPTATQTPVRRTCDAFDDAPVGAGGALQALAIASAARQNIVRRAERKRMRRII